MIRVGIAALSFLLLVGCGNEAPQSQEKETSSPLSSLKETVSKLSHHDKNNTKKFDDIYKHIKHANSQLPDVNKVIQNQIIKQSKHNKEALKQLNDSSQQQFQQLQQAINQLGKDMAKSGY